MRKLTNLKLNPIWVCLLLLAVLLLPTYWRMLRPGIFSMHDFHVFRLYEYDKCIQDLIFPCRWSPDASLGYGQPVFNFYAQSPYIFGEIFRLLGLSVLDSIKALFIASLTLSSVTMFFLSRQLWKNNYAALISGLIYTIAPYRAVDVYVRGALPEALAFVFFPLITYFFNDFVLTKKLRSLLWFVLSFSLLVTTHNLSALMFSLFLSIWGLYFIWLNKAWKVIPQILLSGVLIGALVAYYVVPVATESKLISIGKTTEGYYDFRLHYVTLDQLFLSRFWGYGASFWGEKDDLNLSVGQVQWVVPILAALGLLVFKKFRVHFQFYILLGLGLFFLFLTHGKSDPIWGLVTPLSFIQFPWRFLGSAVFVLALAGGVIALLVKKPLYEISLVIFVCAALIALNTSFFFEDLWFNINDSQQFSGLRYREQASSAIHDFWPLTAKETPTDFAPVDPWVDQGSGSGRLVEKKSHQAIYDFQINSEIAVARFPIVYFPGWEVTSDSRKLDVYPTSELGLISTTLTPQDSKIVVKFANTLVRTIGNSISTIGFMIWLGLFIWALKVNKKL